MATYAIGDVQGCFEPLQRLLHLIQFNAAEDTLWFTGDIVNRGPASLETLRFVKNLGGRHRFVLGNHDLHLLAIAHGAHPGWREDTLSDILVAPDRDELTHWLIQQPLLYRDKKTDFILTHAGIAPQWDLETAELLAKEVEYVLRGPTAADFLQHMYGDYPDRWDPELSGWERLRCITNYFTRMRFCYPDGRLVLDEKGVIGSQSHHLIPWFQMPDRVNKELKIIFGHWAALGGITQTENVYALDTGCVWGYALTAMRLEDGQRFSVTAVEHL